MSSLPCIDLADDEAEDATEAMLPEESNMCLINYTHVTNADRFFTPRPAWSAGSKAAGISFEACLALGIDPTCFQDVRTLAAEVEKNGTNACLLYALRRLRRSMVGWELLLEVALLSICQWTVAGRTDANTLSHDKRNKVHCLLQKT